MDEVYPTLRGDWTLPSARRPDGPADTFATAEWLRLVVEPVFGPIKHARGFLQFLLRGLEKVRGE